ncbi:MAG: DUF4156 domain-containing protein [Pseudomonadota bacterium]
MLKLMVYPTLGVLLAGCAAIEPLPGAQAIIVSRQAAAQDCERLGEVMGSQGNLVTADFTSDKNLIQGARNDMRNKALVLGANYIVLETENLSHNTGETGTGGTFSAVVIGNAYKCPGLSPSQRLRLAEQT